MPKQNFVHLKNLKYTLDISTLLYYRINESTGEIMFVYNTGRESNHRYWEKSHWAEDKLVLEAALRRASM